MNKNIYKFNRNNLLDKIKEKYLWYYELWGNLWNISGSCKGAYQQGFI